MYMAALRTQIYLTADQRRELDLLVEREDVSLAELIREAVDEFLNAHPPSLNEALAASFGAVPEAAATSRSDWDRRARLDG